MSESEKLEKTNHNQNPIPHADSVLSAAKLLIAGLSPDERDRVLSELTKAFRPSSPARTDGADLLTEVIRLLPEQRSWRVEDVRRRIEELGIEAEPKAVYNVLTYLKRRGQIRHEGYGRYTLGDMHIVTSDEVGGAPAWSEIDDT